MNQNNGNDSGLWWSMVIVGAASLALPVVLPLLFSLVGQLVFRDEGLAMIGGLLGFALGVVGTVLSIQWAVRNYHTHSDKHR